MPMRSFITDVLSIWNAAAILVVLAMCVIAVVRQAPLQEQLPGKYDVDGQPQTWGSRRIVLWFYPILTLVLILLVGLDGKKMAPLALYFATMLLVQMLRTLAIGDGRADRLQPWFIPIFIFGIIVLVAVLSLT